MADQKWLECVELFQAALEQLRKNKNDKLRFAAAAKLYEVTFEYTWKAFKRLGDAAGLEVYSPRDSLKAAAQLHLFADLETWQKILNTRNLSVHDYIGLTDPEYYAVMEQFLQELTRLKDKLG